MKTLFKFLTALSIVLLLTNSNILSVVNLGDTNNNGTVSTVDLLPIGFFYGAKGAPRANPTINGQEVPDWEQNAGNLNAKHSDCNGDGVVNETDVAVIYEKLSQPTAARLNLPSNKNITLQPIGLYPNQEQNYFTSSTGTNIVRIPLLFRLTSITELPKISGISFKVKANSSTYYMVEPIFDGQHVLSINDTSILTMEQTLMSEWNFSMTKISADTLGAPLPIEPTGELFRASCIVTIDLNKILTVDAGGNKQTNITITTSDATLLKSNGTFETIATGSTTILVKGR